MQSIEILMVIVLIQSLANPHYGADLARFKMTLYADAAYKKRRQLKNHCAAFRFNSKPNYSSFLVFKTLRPR